MTFRRFLIWIVEKLLEWQLFAAVLIAVKSVLPTQPHSYTSPDSFLRGAFDTWYAAIDEANYMAHGYMNGSYALYAWRTYEAAAYVVVVHFYLLSFYLLASIFACLNGSRGYLRKAVLAFLVGAVILVVRLRQLYDVHNLYLAAALTLGGLVCVLISALVGKAFDARLSGEGPPPKPRADKPVRGKADSRRGRVRFDLGQ